MVVLLAALDSDGGAGEQQPAGIASAGLQDVPVPGLRWLLHQARQDGRSLAVTPSASRRPGAEPSIGLERRFCRVSANAALRGHGRCAGTRRGPSVRSVLSRTRCRRPTTVMECVTAGREERSRRPHSTRGGGSAPLRADDEAVLAAADRVDGLSAVGPMPSTVPTFGGRSGASAVAASRNRGAAQRSGEMPP